MEYNGWTLYEDVTLVIKNELHTRYELPQAYVVNPKDKKQLNSAINWGRVSSYLKDKEGKTLYDADGHPVKCFNEPDVITLKNTGFEVTLLDYARNSSNGGKLSFWNCIVENKEHNIKCVVGIAADLLLSLIIQNRFNYGKCENKVMFARQSGGIGLITEDMVEYQEALNDMQSKKDIKKGNTTKWKIGHNYTTLTIDETYMGGLYCLIKSSSNPNRHYFSYYNSDLPYYIIGMDNTRKNIIVNTSTIPEEIHSNSELKTYLINKCNENKIRLIEKFKDSKNNKHLSILIENMIVVFQRNKYVKYASGSKFPSRQEGNRVIEQDIPIEDVIDDVVKYTQRLAVEILKEYEVSDLRYVAEHLLIRSCRFDDELKGLTDEEKYILKELLKLNNKKAEHKLVDGLYSKVNNL